MSRTRIVTVIVLTAVVVAVAPVVIVRQVAPRPRGVEVELQAFESTPLSRLATVRSRDEVRVALRVHGRDGSDLTAAFSGYHRYHRAPLLGLYPDHANRVTFTVTDREGRSRSVEREIVTGALPAQYPDIQIERVRPDLMSGGMILLHLAAYDAEGTYIPMASVVDRHGRVRWLYTEDYGHLLVPLRNGNLMIEQEDRLVEIDWLGRAPWEGWEIPNGLHHDAVELPDGNILALSAAPGSNQDGMVEVDRATGEITRAWDFREILDPDRPRQPINLEDADWLHLNGLHYDAQDRAAVLSGRDQSAVVKVDLDSGELRWILGNHRHWKEEFRPYLLDPVGEPFEWPWGQHAPELHPADNRRILIYDNGNHRSYDDPLPPAASYSRAVEYLVDEEAGTVEQLWQYGRERGSELFTPFIGDADYLPNGNRLIAFGGISRKLDGTPQALFDLETMEANDMKISAHIVEVTDDTPARRVMELVFEDPDTSTYAGYRIYQAERIDLYETVLGGAGE